MIKSSQIQRRILAATLTVMLLQACMQVRVDAPPALPTPQDIETVAISEQPAATATSTPTTVPATATEISPTATTQPRVVISAVKGNIFIRRGPDMAFNPIGVLYKDTSAGHCPRCTFKLGTDRHPEFRSKRLDLHSNAIFKSGRRPEDLARIHHHRVAHPGLFAKLYPSSNVYPARRGYPAFLVRPAR